MLRILLIKILVKLKTFNYQGSIAKHCNLWLFILMQLYLEKLN